MKIIIKILKYTLLLSPIIILLCFGLIHIGIIDRSKKQPYELISDMDHNARIKPQSFSHYFSDSTIERPEIGNTYPIKSEKYNIDQIDFENADSILSNPLIDNENTELIGKHLFEAYCIYCHGNSGRADGPVITDVNLTDDEEGFPAPPDLTDKRARELSDARVYHILSAGQNLMFPYNDRLNPEKRWALVNYIRNMQKDAEEEIK